MNPRPAPARPLRIAAGLLAPVLGCPVLAGGCAKDPTPYAVAGTVTFKGQPVPAGRIYFDPDPRTNPDSPQGFADIAGGRYDTAKGGRGTRGGTFTARVEGFDGKATAAFPHGQLLFDDYRVTVELPAEDARKDFDVPASAARKGPASAP